MASPSPMTRRRSPSAGSTRLIARHCRAEACLALDERGHRVALGLVNGFQDVTRILAVDLQRERDVAAHDDAVDVVAASACPSLSPDPRTPCTSSRGRSRARSLTGAKNASPSSKLALGTRSSPTEPEYVYGVQFATRTSAARPAPSISSCSSNRARRSLSTAAVAFTNATSPGRLPSGLVRAGRRGADQSAGAPMAVDPATSRSSRRRGRLRERRARFDEQLEIEGVGRAAFVLVANGPPYTYAGSVGLDRRPARASTRVSRSSLRSGCARATSRDRSCTASADPAQDGHASPPTTPTASSCAATTRSRCRSTARMRVTSLDAVYEAERDAVTVARVRRGASPYNARDEPRAPRRRRPAPRHRRRRVDPRRRGRRARRGRAARSSTATSCSCARTTSARSSTTDRAASAPTRSSGTTRRCRPAPCSRSRSATGSSRPTVSRRSGSCAECRCRPCSRGGAATRPAGGTRASSTSPRSACRSRRRSRTPSGFAWGSRLKGEDRVALTLFGDGATSEGSFHEGATFAGVMKAPVILFCNNNQWAISTPLVQQTAAPTLADKAIGYGMPGVRVDGGDVLAVYEATRDAVERARAGDGPTFIEAVTYRAAPHATADDPSLYIDQERVEEERENECVGRYERYLRRARRAHGRAGGGDQARGARADARRDRRGRGRAARRRRARLRARVRRPAAVARATTSPSCGGSSGWLSASSSRR